MNQSLPVIKPQPTTSVYGSGELNLFVEYNDRALYEKFFGEQAELWDGTLPIKKWKDDSKKDLDPGTQVTYHDYVVGKDGKATKVSFTISAGFAAKVNLTGAKHYPAAVIKESFVTLGGFHVPKEELSMYADAVALAIELGRSSSDVVENTANQPFVYSYPADEPRRVWEIVYSQNLQGMLAGHKIAEKNSFGVGAPGHWVPPPSDHQEPTFVPDLPNTGETGPVHPQLPVPKRDLLANEELVTDANAVFSGVGYVIHRKDQVLPGSVQTVNNAGGGMTSAQAQQLIHVFNTCNLILTTVQTLANPSVPETPNP